MNCDLQEYRSFLPWMDNSEMLVILVARQLQLPAEAACLPLQVSGSLAYDNNNSAIQSTI
jgi:hypothetical protein